MFSQNDILCMQQKRLRSEKTQKTTDLFATEKEILMNLDSEEKSKLRSLLTARREETFIYHHVPWLCSVLSMFRWSCCIILHCVLMTGLCVCAECAFSGAFHVVAPTVAPCCSQTILNHHQHSSVTVASSCVF